MAKNDTILLDGIIDDRITTMLPSDRRDEVFEYLAFEQILKSLDLSREEIECGSVDGENDGGIDGLFVFVNGHLLADPESFVWPRTGSELELWIITCKHHETFQQAPLDKLVASLVELLDFALYPSDYKGEYSQQIQNYRENLKLAYRKLSPRLRKFRINFAYASRGDTTKLGDAVVARADQIVSIAKDFFSDCETGFFFYGSTELVELHRQIPNFSLELPFLEVLSRGENYLLLADLGEYYRFVSDNGKLRRYLFDSNVRDFMGFNRVNEDIRDTLKNSDSPDFWWLNNGVTILASAASVVGKSIKIEDIQIVNGLQTTESIFRHFQSGSGIGDPKGRSILIKVVVSNDEDDRDAIIRSTNNQTLVELASLHATDKIQRDIEDVLERSGLYYERRKNYYANLGHVPSEIVTPLYLGAGYVALALKNPTRAVSLRSRFMRSEQSYNRVFSSNVPIDLWPRIAAILKQVDRVLESRRPKRKGTAIGEKFLKGWRYITSFLAVAHALGTFNYSTKELSTLDIKLISDQDINNILDFIWEGRKPGPKSNLSKKSSFATEVCRSYAQKIGILGVEHWIAHGRITVSDPRRQFRKDKKPVAMEFALKVNELLPPQPWKPGMEKEIVKVLGCTLGQYFAATSLLIDEGIRNNQKDGVVYDQDGNVLSFDVERVNPETMELIEPLA